MSEPLSVLPDLASNLSEYTGETTRVRLEIPVIRVSYKAEDDETKVAAKGEFIEYDPATKKSSPLGKSITIQILHHRQSLSAYKDEDSYFTPEVSMREKTFALFLRSAEGKTSFLQAGDTKGLRESFPELRYQRILYVLHDNKLKKLSVYGASFSKFLDFTKSLQGKSSSSVSVVLTTGKEKKGTVIYYPVIFTAGAASDIATLEPVLKKLALWFDAFDAKNRAEQANRVQQAEIDRGDFTPGATVITSSTLEEASNLFEENPRVTPDEADKALGLE